MSSTTIEHVEQRTEPAFRPVGHYAHPDDPSKRTALCLEPILGIPAFGEHATCLHCLILWAAQDWLPLPE